MSDRRIVAGARFLRAAVAAVVVGVLWSILGISTAQSADSATPDDHKADAEKFFRKRVTPFIKTYCLECHQNKRPTEAGLSFTPALQGPGDAAFSEKWKKAAARVKAHDMPPEGLEQPTDEERQMFMDWLDKVKYLSPKDPGPFVIRRLTKTEYGNTLHDLFGVDPSIADGLPDEVSGEGYLNSLSPLQLEQYLAVADEVLDQVLGPDDSPRPELLQRLSGEPPAAGDDARARAREIAASLTRKVYRRPASDAELNVLVDVFDLAQENELPYPASLRLMLKAMLVSPQFLFITPADGLDPEAEIVPLDDHQLASRLSYLLWATMPQTWKENQAGLNEAYYSHCSFRSPTQAVPAEINPRNVLNRLFTEKEQGGGRASTGMSPLDRNMLDLVLGGARDLRRTLSPTDQRKLDEYLDSVRSVERRIAAIEMRQKEAAMEKAGVRSSRRHESDSPPIEIKIPEGDRRSEYMQVMCDLNVLAFQTDTTRVCTYIGSTPNGASYPELGFNDQHHSTTHHNDQTEKVSKVAAITAFNIEQFAYMVKKMHGLREGDGTLLDNCIMMWGSGLEDGNKHTRENLPFILAGRGGGSIKTGRFLPGVQGNQGDLLTTLLTCAGIPMDRPVGIATKQINEIAA